MTCKVFRECLRMKKTWLLIPAAVLLVSFYSTHILAYFDIPIRLLFFSFPIFAEIAPLTVPNLTGRVAIVTGGNAGIGFETVKALAHAGCKVVMTSRDMPRGEEAKTKLSGDVIVKQLDLSSLASVESFVKEFVSLNLGRLDFLVLNAGKWPQGIQKTEDGLEWMVGSHHIGHFHLTTLLMPVLKQTAAKHKESRVVVTSSAALVMAPKSPVKWKSFERPDVLEICDSTAYGASKLANALFAFELHKRYGSSGLVVSANHPGSVKTELHYLQPCNYMLGMCFSPEQGALANLQGCVNKKAAGRFFLPGGAMAEDEEIPHAARDAKASADLWKWSEKVIAQKRK